MNVKAFSQNRKIRAAEKKNFIDNAYDDDPLKFKDWFSIKEIRKELKKVSWLNVNELVKTSFVVITFTLLMMAFFFFSDTAIAEIINSLF